ADVAIVGGGPTGLLLASELRLAGIDVVLLERRPGGIGQVRAMGLHSRSLELFAMRGIADRFIKRGNPIPFGNFAGLETMLDMSVIESTHAFVLVLPQTITEEILHERAVETGVDLRHCWTVESVEATEDGVTLSGNADGEQFLVEAQYVVGADG